MKPDEFGEELRALDREFEARGMPADVDARLRERLERPSRRMPWVPVVLATAAAAVIAFVLISTPTKVGGLVVEQSSGFSARFEDRIISVKEGTATLKDTEFAASMSVQPGVELERYTSGAKVHHGRVHFEVERLASRTASYSVSVSHGVIEVMGTSFVIVQGADSGTVHLFDGSIRFLAPDGRVVKLRPGDSLQWPLLPIAREAPTPIAPPVEKPRVAPRPPPTPVPGRARGPACPRAGRAGAGARSRPPGLDVPLPSLLRRRCSPNGYSFSSKKPSHSFSTFASNCASSRCYCPTLHSCSTRFSTQVSENGKQDIQVQAETAARPDPWNSQPASARRRPSPALRPTAGCVAVWCNQCTSNSRLPLYADSHRRDLQTSTRTG